MTNALTFTNDGAITVSAGTLYIEPNSFTDASGGSITVDNSATASIGSSGANTAWSNAGTVTINSGGTLYLWGTFTTASLAGFTDSDGTVYLDGTLTNTGATLAVGSGGTFAPLTFASHGTIVGGTITDAGSGMVFSGGTLQGPITYEGTMNLTPSGSSVFVTGNTTTAGGVYLTVETTVGATPGAINIGSNSYLYLENSQTLNNATITLSGTAAYVESDDTTGSSEVLTFGPNLTIDQTGTSGAIATTYDDSAASTIVNEGTINVQAGTLYIESMTNALTFTNDGAINISGGATAYIEPTTFNNGTGTVDFLGTGTLELGSSVTSFTEVIGNFGVGDIIDLKNLSYASSDTVLWTQTATGASAGGTLAIRNSSGTVLETLNLAGTYSPTEFKLQGDSGGGTSGDVEVVLNTTLTADTWTGAGGNSEWLNSANWSTGVPAGYSEVSISGATVTFNSSASPDTVYSISTSTNSGLALNGAVMLTVSNGFNNSGSLSIDSNYADPGGGSLTVDGTLTNSGDVYVGGNPVTAATLTVGGLSNTGTISISGGGGGETSLTLPGFGSCHMDRHRRSERRRLAGIFRQ